MAYILIWNKDKKIRHRHSPIYTFEKRMPTSRDLPSKSVNYFYDYMKDAENYYRIK